jgi:hypothetical protein
MKFEFDASSFESEVDDELLAKVNTLAKYLTLYAEYMKKNKPENENKNKNENSDSDSSHRHPALFGLREDLKQDDR